MRLLPDWIDDRHVVDSTILIALAAVDASMDISTKVFLSMYPDIAKTRLPLVRIAPYHSEAIATHILDLFFQLRDAVDAYCRALHRNASKTELRADDINRPDGNPTTNFEVHELT